MTNNILTVPVSISCYHNTDERNFDMTLNLSSTNTMASTITAAVHEKPSDTIEKYPPNNSRMIKIELQTLLLMMMLNHSRHTEK